MAVTAVIAPSPTGAPAGGVIEVSLALTNGGSTAVIVENIAPFVNVLGTTKQNVPVSIGSPVLNPLTQTLTLQAAETQTIKFNVIPHSSGPLHGDKMFAWYDVGANVTVNDAGTRTTISPSVEEFACTEWPTVEQCGLLDFSKFECSQYVPGVLL